MLALFKTRKKERVMTGRKGKTANHSLVAFLTFALAWPITSDLDMFLEHQMRTQQLKILFQPIIIIIERLGNTFFFYM